MTDLEVLKEAYETLENLDIPVKYLERLGIPIANTSLRLRALYQAVTEALEKRKEEIPAEESTTEITEEPAPEPEAEN